MIKTSNWFAITFVNFFIAACYGVLMRYAFIEEIDWLDFRNIMHGHSHVAMLGWLYLSIYLLLLHFFIKDGIQKKFYQYNFILTEITVIGMAISFPLQGYGLFSIFFSTVHVLLSYAFIVQFFRDVKGNNSIISHSTLLARTALIFMFISTLALFAMAPIMVMDLRSSNLYFMAVQFFLHFQFNGWFIFAILALLFRLIENLNISIANDLFRKFYWYLVISCFLTYALAVTWSNPSPFLFGLNSLGVIIQLGALLYFIRIIRNIYPEFRRHISGGLNYLLTLSFISFCLKIIVQTAVMIPYIAKIAYTVRNFVIGFIHLILLGVVTLAIVAFASRIGYIKGNRKMISNAILVLVTGVFLSEFLLFLQGTLLWGAKGFIPYYYEALFGVSALIPLGILMMLYAMMNRSGTGDNIHLST